MSTQFGFSGLNKSLNRNLNNDFNTAQNLTLTSVRVKSIVLDESHPRFKELGEWSALGAIEFQFVEEPFKKQTYPIAYPLNPNIKNYPLLEEIVYIFALPDNKLYNTNVSKKQYYLNIVGLWNHPHHNAYPSVDALPSDQNKDINQINSGSPKISNNLVKQTKLGNTFKERSNIHPLLPFEGDVIMEGRWGNSIRLGSTVLDKNEWSKLGKDGDPLIILRNGQGKQDNKGWFPILEDINNDDSSIYITSTQSIPLIPSSEDYIEYDEPPINIAKFKEAQIILSSGRLVFNSKKDHILLSSAKSINLNSIESVNINTDKFITQADKIFLGKEELATEPLLLGNTTTELLRDLINITKKIADSLKNLETSPTVPGSSVVFPDLPIQMASAAIQLDSIKEQLNNITSKKNFTL